MEAKRDKKQIKMESVTIRIPTDIYEKMRKEAKRKNRNINYIVVKIFNNYYNKKDHENS